jgi:hypothetical protein
MRQRRRLQLSHTGRELLRQNPSFRRYYAARGASVIGSQCALQTSPDSCCTAVQGPPVARRSASNPARYSGRRIQGPGAHEVVTVLDDRDERAEFRIAGLRLHHPASGRTSRRSGLHRRDLGYTADRPGDRLIAGQASIPASESHIAVVTHAAVWSIGFLALGSGASGSARIWLALIILPAMWTTAPMYRTVTSAHAVSVVPPDTLGRATVASSLVATSVAACSQTAAAYAVTHDVVSVVIVVVVGNTRLGSALVATVKFPQPARAHAVAELRSPIIDSESRAFSARGFRLSSYTGSPSSRYSTQPAKPERPVVPSNSAP